MKIFFSMYWKPSLIPFTACKLWMATIYYRYFDWSSNGCTDCSLYGWRYCFWFLL